MKLARFYNIQHNYTTVKGQDFTDAEGYVRISEWVDVEFPPLPDNLEREIQALEYEIAKQEKICDGVQEMKDRLLQLRRLEAGVYS